MAVANAGSNNVSVLLGDGAGGFAASAINSVTPTFNLLAPPLMSADLDANGKSDLVVVNQSSNLPIVNYLSVLMGRGDGNFAAAINYPVEGTPSSLTIADFNVDGKPDLVMTDRGGPMGNLTVLLGGNEAGSFAPAVNFKTETLGGGGPITSADFNLDGKPDLVVTSYDGISYTFYASVLLGNGAGSFAAAINFAEVGANPGVLTSADFNVDGKPDLAVTNYGSGNVSVLLGNGAGGFANAVNFATGTGLPFDINPFSILSADFNSDGKPDLAVANFGSNNVSILLGDGAGSFAAAANFATGLHPVSIVSADFNADGKLDLVVANAGGNNMSVLLGDGAGGFAKPLI